MSKTIRSIDSYTITQLRTTQTMSASLLLTNLIHFSKITEIINRQHPCLIIHLTLSKQAILRHHNLSPPTYIKKYALILSPILSKLRNLSFTITTFLSIFKRAPPLLITPSANLIPFKSGYKPDFSTETALPYLQ